MHIRGLAQGREYWNDAKLNQVSPGIDQLSRTQLSTTGNYTYLAITVFDEFGRRRAEIHYSTHPSTGVIHPNPHYHLYEGSRRLILMPGEYLGE